MATSTLICASVLCVLLITDRVSLAQTRDMACPANTVAIQPGASIQAAVDRAGDGAGFCLKNGIYKMQAVQPRSNQRFYGEGRTVLDGSRLLTDFKSEGHYWTAKNPFGQRPRHGECMDSAPACDRPDSLFMDDRPLTRVLSRSSLAPNQFYVDAVAGKVYLADNPTGHRIEATAASFAFDSGASGILISNITVEKYSSAAQRGAIYAGDGKGWTIENCEVRLNSGPGISVGSGIRVRNCDVHHNGQIGIQGDGKDILIEGNRVWANNTRGFDPAWEAGGVKIAESDGIVFRDNHVYENDGTGLWCDIECRNTVYEGNLVENNRHIGIFHEISFNAVIRNNIVRHNASANRKWFWGTDIGVAASQDVEVTGNTITTAAGGCAIMLFDQGRRSDNGTEYKTRNNSVRSNAITFEGAPCAGGASDTTQNDENFDIITKGNNRFDGNVYRAPRGSGPDRFAWGREITDWAGFRRKGLEKNGQLDLF